MSYDPAQVQLVESTITSAMTLYANRQASGAERLLRVATQLAPDVTRAHAALGSLLVAERRFAEAAPLFGRCIELDPGNPDWPLSQADVLMAIGAWMGAAVAIETALKLEYTAALLRRASYAHLQAGDVAQATVRAREAVRFEPDDPYNHYLLGLALTRSGGSDDEAFASLEKAISVGGMKLAIPVIAQLSAIGATALVEQLRRRFTENENDMPFLYYVALANHYKGLADGDAALRQLELAMAVTEDDSRDELRFQIAVMRGAEGWESMYADDPPPEAVRARYAPLAPEWSRRRQIGDLYQAPLEVSAAVRAVCLDSIPVPAIIDLGCGSGLIGRLVRSMCDQLVGVDITAEMLDAAQTQGCYHQLVHADVLRDDLPAHPQVGTGYDVAISVGLANCVYDMRNFAARIRALLKPQGAAVIVVEVPVVEDRDLMVDSLGGFSHGRSRIESGLSEGGLTITHMREIVVSFRGPLAVPGLIVTAVRAD